MLNAYWEPLIFKLAPPDHRWRRWVDTSLTQPEDIYACEQAPRRVSVEIHGGATLLGVSSRPATDIETKDHNVTVIRHFIMKLCC
jgi:hypothetical protein